MVEVKREMLEMIKLRQSGPASLRQSHLSGWPSGVGGWPPWKVAQSKGYMQRGWSGGLGRICPGSRVSHPLGPLSSASIPTPSRCCSHGCSNAERIPVRSFFKSKINDERYGVRKWPWRSVDSARAELILTATEIDTGKVLPDLWVQVQQICTNDSVCVSAFSCCYTKRVESGAEHIVEGQRRFLYTQSLNTNSVTSRCRWSPVAPLSTGGYRTEICR